MTLAIRELKLHELMPYAAMKQWGPSEFYEHMMDDGLVVSWADQRTLQAEEGAENVVVAL
jgi:hypothetical protein